jgi:hypothetical protein
MVDDETILTEVARNRNDLKSAAKALVRAANKGGGEDNITVVFFEIGGEDLEHTVTLPPRETGAEPEADEDTLNELDKVPAIETVNGDGGRRREPRGSGRRVLGAILALALLVGASGFVVWGLWRSHFVGAEADGHVAVYQGVPWNIVGDMHLYRTTYVSPLLAAQLSQPERRKLFDHSLRSEGSALAAVRRYEEQIGAR